MTSLAGRHRGPLCVLLFLRRYFQGHRAFTLPNWRRCFDTNRQGCKTFKTWNLGLVAMIVNEVRKVTVEEVSPQCSGAKIDKAYVRERSLFKMLNAVTRLFCSPGRDHSERLLTHSRPLFPNTACRMH